MQISSFVLLQRKSTRTPPPTLIILQFPSYKAKLKTLTILMVTKEKDVEAGTPLYAPHASPKPNELQEDEPQAEGASIPVLVLASMPRMAVNMAWASFWAALGPFFGRVLSTTAVRTIQVIGPLSGLVVGPIVGGFSDQSTNCWGRRRPFLLSGAVLAAISLVTMGYTDDIGKALGDSGSGLPGEQTTYKATGIVMVLLYAWLSIALNVVQTPLILLVADLAGERQILGAALGMCWSVLGSIVVYAYIEIWGSAYLTLHYFLGMLAVVLLVSIGIVCAFIKEDSHTLAIGGVFSSITSMPVTLVVYGIVATIVSYGVTLYQGNKQMFFSFDVLNGSPQGSYMCEPYCTKQQEDFNRATRLFDTAHIMSYDALSCLCYLLLPLLVQKFGTKSVLIGSFVPQALLVIIAFLKVLTIAIIVDVAALVCQSIAFILLVPTAIHVFGTNADIGACVGVLTAVSSIGQLVSIAVGSSLVDTSMGFKLPVLLAGILGLVGILLACVFLKLKMHH